MNTFTKAELAETKATQIKRLQSTILLVDDTPANLLSLQGVLANGSRTFYKAGSGNEALKIALNEPLSLILMDINMPEMDGLETARLLRLNPRTRPIPIIFVSAINPNEHVSLIEFESGTVDFLFKPLNLQDTKTKVALFEKLWQTTQELYALKKDSIQTKKDFEQFVYMVSHDLKTPLRAITNLSDWIAEEMPEISHSIIKENLSLLKDRVLRMNLMLDGILAFSRAGRINEEPENINPKQLVHAVFESLQSSGGILLETTGTWPELVTVKTKLEKVLRELIGNAIAHHNRTDGIVRVDCSFSDHKLTFTVFDNGPGIKPQYHNTIFEMFQTVKSKDHKPASGAGLAIAKKIVEQQGGIITLESIDSKGSAFSFTWPF